MSVKSKGSAIWICRASRNGALLSETGYGRRLEDRSEPMVSRRLFWGWRPTFAPWTMPSSRGGRSAARVGALSLWDVFERAAPTGRSTLAPLLRAHKLDGQRLYRDGDGCCACAPPARCSCAAATPNPRDRPPRRRSRGQRTPYAPARTRCARPQRGGDDPPRGRREAPRCVRVDPAPLERPGSRLRRTNRRRATTSPPRGHRARTQAPVSRTDRPRPARADFRAARRGRGDTRANHAGRRAGPPLYVHRG